MNVYVLSSTDFNGVDFVYVEGVFDSYEVMLQYVKDRFTTEKGEPLKYLVTAQGYGCCMFIGDFLDEDGNECKLKYSEYEVIGEHSVKTDKIEFK